MFQHSVQKTISFLAFLIAALLTPSFGQQPSQSGSAQDLDPRFVDVGHGKLYVDCVGKVAGPTVILLSGANQPASTWSKVQPEVSSFARVCSYDRMGTGSSDRMFHEQAEKEIVADLHSFLDAAKIAPPYILVGHSIGGVYARKFATTYPGTVAGFIFVDSAHEEEVWRLAKISPVLLAEFPAWPSVAKLTASGMLPSGRLLDWRFDGPMVVLEHGIMWPRGIWKGLTEEQYEEVKQAWHDMQVDLSSRSKEGQLRVAEHSGHFIQNQQPELVIAAVHDVIESVRR